MIRVVTSTEDQARLVDRIFEDAKLRALEEWIRGRRRGTVHVSFSIADNGEMLSVYVFNNERIPLKA